MGIRMSAGVIVLAAVAASTMPREAAAGSGAAGRARSQVEYRVLATTRTSTMEKELNEAADEGFRFGGVMGGETAFGGSEVVAVITRVDGAKPRYEYKLLATNRTSTMQKEMQEAGDDGYVYCSQTVFKSTFGGKEVAVILERERGQGARPRYEYKLLATRRTGTMEDELGDAGKDGFEFVGITVAQTSMGGQEVVCILRRQAGK
jgi:hypothetical protein